MPSPNLTREACCFCGLDVEPGAGWYERQVREIPAWRGARGAGHYGKQQVGVTWHDHCSAEARDRHPNRSRPRPRDADDYDGDPIPLDEMFW